MSFTKNIYSLVKDFLSLFYPNLCLACRKQSVDGEIICPRCELELPETGFHNISDNALEERFWGRIQLENAAAKYFFSKTNVTQELIYQLKYASKPQVGEILGEWYGQDLANSRFSEIDGIVPIPLHPKRLYQRGYNQSLKIANGLSKTMNKPVLIDAVQRIVNTTTQTKTKSKIDRFENVKNAFHIANPELLKDKHILLVDDVITTGATIEACATKIFEVENVKISVVALGLATDLV